MTGLKKRCIVVYSFFMKILCFILLIIWLWNLFNIYNVYIINKAFSVGMFEPYLVCVLQVSVIIVAMMQLFIYIFFNKKYKFICWPCSIVIFQTFFMAIYILLFFKI